MNLRTVLENVVVLKRCEKVLTGTEQFIELRLGYRIQIRAGSGLAINKGIIMLNSPVTMGWNERGKKSYS